MSWLQCFDWDRNQIPLAPFCTLRYCTCCHITGLITCYLLASLSVTPLAIMHIWVLCIHCSLVLNPLLNTLVGRQRHFAALRLVSCAMAMKLNLICRQCKLYLVRQRVLIVLLLPLSNLEPKILIPILGCTALTLNFLLSFLPRSPSPSSPLYLQQDAHGSIWSRPSCSFLGVYRLWEWFG